MLPTTRYGTSMPPTRRRRLAIALGVLVAAAGLAVAVLAYQRVEGVDAQAEVDAFRVVDEQTVEITLSVTRKDPARPAVCIVRALASDRAETGRREVLVPASSGRTVQVRTVVKSYRSPFAGDVYGCGADVPGYLVAP